MAKKPTSRRRGEQANFLDAIAAAPEDDTVRPIFADWWPFPNPPIPAPRTGAVLLAYWQGEGVVATRPDIADSAAHARALREQAERGMRP
jgi:hypothetical protein